MTDTFCIFPVQILPCYCSVQGEIFLQRTIRTALNPDNSQLTKKSLKPDDIYSIEATSTPTSLNIRSFVLPCILWFKGAGCSNLPGQRSEFTCNEWRSPRIENKTFTEILKTLKMLRVEYVVGRKEWSQCFTRTKQGSSASMPREPVALST